jgi:hypothetical protein
MSEEADMLPFMLVSVIADDNDMTEDCVLLSLRPLMVLTTCRELGFEVITWLRLVLNLVALYICHPQVLLTTLTGSGDWRWGLPAVFSVLTCMIVGCLSFDQAVGDGVDREVRACHINERPLFDIHSLFYFRCSRMIPRLGRSEYFLLSSVVSWQ